MSDRSACINMQRRCAEGTPASAADRADRQDAADPGVSAEAACAAFHKALPRKRALMPPTVRPDSDYFAGGLEP
jgi:hypothetical protein